jgi:3-oxo-5alpha-steroid 4-dehydrogenase
VAPATTKPRGSTTTTKHVPYLQLEVRGAVGDDTLRRFCEDSFDMIEWLERQGAAFQASLAPYKTSYPTDRH